MKPTAKQLGFAFFETMIDAKDDKTRKEYLKKFTKYLIKISQTSKTEEIIRYFKQYWNEHHGIKEARIVSSKKLDSSLEKNIKSFLDSIAKEKYGAGKYKKIEITYDIDKNVLGGYRMTLEDYMYDYSLKGKIKNLKTQLIKKF